MPGQTEVKGSWLLSVLLVVVLSAPIACSSGTTTPGDAFRADRAAPDGDSAPPPADLDATPPDVAPPDLPPPPDPKRAQEVVSGAGLSKSTSYQLQSQVGMAVGPALQTGGLYALRWNASVIPW